MIEALFQQPGYMAAQRMLDAAVVRHNAIASNIANIDTPNYRRMDLDPNFSADLSRAMTSGDLNQLQALKPTAVVDATAVATNGDGNTVSLERELLDMNQNQVLHALESQLLTGSLLKLRLAITGRQA